MKATRKTAVLMALVLTLVGIGTGIPSAVLAEDMPVAALRDEAGISRSADEIARAYADMNWLSGVVLVAKAGEPVYAQLFGMANQQDGIANTMTTRFALGSIMKNYTAVMVLQQVERGALSLDDTLGQFGFGFSDPRAKAITIRQLLHHRSGFGDIFTAEYRENQLAFDTIEKRLTLLRDKPLEFDPGTDERYSNYGFDVLGAVLEKVGGKPFAQMLRDNILTPLSLTHSVYPYDPEVGEQSLRYSYNYAGEQSFVGLTEAHGPDGGLEATAADVLAFYRAIFYSDTLLRRDGEAFADYFGTHPVFWQSFGGGAGVSAAVELDLVNDYQVVVLSNSDNLVAELVSGRIVEAIRTGRYTPAALPPHVYAYQQYKQLGVEAFRERFGEIYKAAGYTQFIGRTLNELGISLLADSKWDEALEVFGALAATFPNAPQVYDSLARAYRDMGKPDKAQQAFSKALALVPDFRSDYSEDNYGVAKAQ